MKNNFIFLAIFLIAFVSLASAFESQQYNISTKINEGGINVDIGNDIEANIINCTNGETTCSGTNYFTCVDNSWINNGNIDGQCGYTTTTTPSGGNSPSGSGNPSNSLLSSAVDYLSNAVSGNSEENSDVAATPEEKIEKIGESSSTSFLTGAVTGVTDFVKSPKKVAVSFIVLLGCVFGIVIFRKKSVKVSDEKESPEKVEENEMLSDEEPKGENLD